MSVRSVSAADAAAVAAAVPRSDIGPAVAMGVGANGRPKKGTTAFVTPAGALVGTQLTAAALTALPFMATTRQAVEAYVRENSRVMSVLVRGPGAVVVGGFDAQLAEILQRAGVTVEGNPAEQLDALVATGVNAPAARKKCEGEIDDARTSAEDVRRELEVAQQQVASLQAALAAAGIASAADREADERARQAASDLKQARTAQDTADAQQALDEAHALAAETARQKAAALAEAARLAKQLQETTDSANTEQDHVEEGLAGAATALLPYAKTWETAMGTLVEFAGLETIAAKGLDPAKDVNIHADITTWGELADALQEVGKMAKGRFEAIATPKKNAFADAWTGKTGKTKVARNTGQALVAGWHSLYTIASVEISTRKFDAAADIDTFFRVMVRVMFYTDYLLTKALASKQAFGTTVNKSFESTVNNLDKGKTLSVAAFGVSTGEEAYGSMGTRSTAAADNALYLKSSTAWWSTDNNASSLLTSINDDFEEAWTVTAFGGGSFPPTIGHVSYT